MIEVRNLRKSFGDVSAVRDVSFRAEDGEITGLLGPNGAGKTTSLRILYGLVKADGGSVTVDQLDALEHPKRVQRMLGVLPDSRGLYARLTAREHLRYYGQLQGVERDRLEESIQELSDQLGMAAIIDRRVQGFSQGERVKVAVGRALVHGPRNVVLDEPTNGLDVKSTGSMRQLIREIRDQGKCVLFSSHVMQEVTALCDRIVILSGGVTVAQGTPEEIVASTGHETLEDAFLCLTGIEEVQA